MNTGRTTELVSDPISFQNEEFQKWDRLQEAFRTPGPEGHFPLGVISEEIEPTAEGYKSIVHFADPYEGLKVDKDGKISGNTDSAVTVVSLPSYASKAEVDSIIAKIIPMPETSEILLTLARAKDMNCMVLLEGDTSLGKTFGLETFVELLYGPGIKPLDFYCNGQTDVSELHGMWVPKVQSPEEQQRWNKFIESQAGTKKLEDVLDSAKNRAEFSPEQQREAILSDLARLAKDIGLSSNTSWEFAAGAIERTFSAVFDPIQRRITDFREGGRGFPLHLQEAGGMAPKVANTLLECGGKNGQLADSIQIWRHFGKTVKRGPEAFIVLTTNPADGAGFSERNELDRALENRLIPVRFLEGLSPFSTFLASKSYFTYRAGNLPESKPRGSVIELYNYPDEIGQTLAKVVSAFHSQCVLAFKSGERGAKSTVVPTLRKLAQLADYMLRFQIRDRLNGGLDIVETLRRGVEFIYLKGVTDPTKRQDQLKALETILNGEKLSIKGELGTVTPREYLEKTVRRIYKEQSSRQAGYSSELVRSSREALSTRVRAAATALRNGILSREDVPDPVKRVIQ